MMSRHFNLKSILSLWISRDCLIYTLVFFSIVLISSKAEQDCGEYYQLGTSTTGSLYSPDYPNQYGTYVKCIWLLYVDSSAYRVKLSVTFKGERYNGECSDYLEIRDGNSSATQIAKLCDTHSNAEYTSHYKWMWVMFKSDGISGSGTALQADFSAVSASSAAVYKREAARDCRSYEFECRNRQCLSMSYRCDGYNDCGCIANCDEDGCGALSLTSGVQMGISLSVGVVVFIIICIMAIIFEGKAKWMASKKEENYCLPEKIVPATTKNYHPIIPRPNNNE